VRIYRNIDGDSTEFHLVAELSAGETSFIDNIPDADIIGNPEVDLMGPKATSGTLLTDVILRDGETYSTPFEEGVLQFTGQKGGRTLSTKEFTISATTTLGELLIFMDEALGIVEPDDSPYPGAGIAINGGVIEVTSDVGIANALDIGLSAFTLQPTGSQSSSPISINFDETQEAQGAGSITDFVVFDSLGIPVSVRITTALESKDGDSTTYRWYATSPDNEPLEGVDTVLGSGILRFDGNGRIVGNPVASVAVERESTASELLEFDLDFSHVSGLAVSNNLGESTSTMSMTRQDGFPPGTLTSFIVTESGLIRGVFSNGTERPLGQVRMARFANNAGLQQVGDNVFTEGVNSGEPIQGNPGENGLGNLTAGAVELSNTDIGQNLIELILASTQYRGGTRVITAAQQLLDELMSLRR
jgi:flagellar hook protein FlgE